MPNTRRDGQNENHLTGLETCEIPTTPSVVPVTGQVPMISLTLKQLAECNQQD